MQAFEVTHEIIAALVAEEKGIGRHDGCAADLGRVAKMQLEPERRTASANLGEIGTLTAIADQRRTLLAEFLKSLSRSPH